MADPFVQDLVRSIRPIAQTYTPAQMGQFAGLMTGAGGIADLFGAYPAVPEKETTFTEMLRGERSPSFFENIRDRAYLDAGLQFAGVIPGVAALGSIPLAVKASRSVRPVIRRGKAKEGIAQLFRGEHASPFDFDEYKLDPTTIKTGEGGNVQGQGIYLSRNPQVAEYYQAMAKTKAKREPPEEDSIARMLEDEYGLSDMSPTDAQFNPGGSLAEDYGTTDRRETFSAFVDDLIDEGGEIGAEGPEVTRTIGRQNELRLEFDDGSAYNIIYDEDGMAARMVPTGSASAFNYITDVKVDPNLLADYDAPLRAQSQNVKNAIVDVVDESLNRLPKEKLVDFGLSVLKKGEVAEEFGVPSKVNKKLKGALAEMPEEQLRRGLKQSLLDQERSFEDLSQAFSLGFEVENIFSIELAKKGIKGAQYNDKFSRGATGFQTKNMVVYDPAILSIASKYKLMVPLAAGVAAGTITAEEAIAQQKATNTAEGIGTLDMDKPTARTSGTNQRENAALSRQMKQAGLPVQSSADAADIEPEIKEQLDIILDRTDPEG